VGRFSLVILFALFAASCQQEAAYQVACPYIRQYDRATIERALVEYRALPKGSALRTLIGDYENLRDQVRACQSYRP
jgi:hypothetical protein